MGPSKIWCNTSFVTILAAADTAVISLSSVFAVTTQELLGSCIFLFAKHPYGDGDRVDIVGPSGTGYLIAEQISLLYSVFKSVESMKVVQVPNIVLNMLWIENITRPRALKGQFDICISFDTSLDDTELLRKEIEGFVRDPDNCRHFLPGITLEATGIGNMDILQLKVVFSHKNSYQNETMRAARRSKSMYALVLSLRKIPVYAPGGDFEPLGGPTNPSYSVTIPDSWATEVRKNAARSKGEGHLIHLSPPIHEPTTSEPSKDNGSKPKVDAVHRDTNNGWNLRDPRLARCRSWENKELDQPLSIETRGVRRPGEAVRPATPAEGAGVPATGVCLRSHSSSTSVYEEAEMGT